MSRRRRALSLIAAFFLVESVLVSGGAGGSTLVDLGASDDFKLELKTGSFTPLPGIDLSGITQGSQATEQRVHFLVQFKSLPETREKRALADQGLNLLGYLDGNTYFASADKANLAHVSELRGVRWMGRLTPEMKIDPVLAAGRIGSWAEAPDGRVALTAQVHPDVTMDEAKAAVRRAGGEVLVEVPAVPSVTALFERDDVNTIAGQDEVQYVAVVDAPLEPHNDGARPAINVTPLAGTPYNLTGTGATVLVYDSGRVDPAHTDFNGRFVQTDPDPAETIREHSTHVAGTALGDGLNSNGNDNAAPTPNPNNGTANQWAGMAPAAGLATYGSSGSTDTLYDSAGDINNDFTTAIGLGVDLATMSLGNNTGSNGFPCGQLGDYTNTSILLDNIVRGSIAGQQLIYFESAGNERNQACATATGFSTISSPAPAKNTIVVGAINSDDNSMTAFSSWGPTDDGRLRPDLVGPGCQTNAADVDVDGDGDFDQFDDTGIYSPSFDDLPEPGQPRGDGNLDAGEVQNSYVAMCGTSMATPALAGAMALVVQQWESTRAPFSVRPRADTAKAIFVHTATDLGNAGPDYQNGYGQVNAQAAVDLVRADDSADLINVDQVDNGQTDFYTFNSDGSAPVRVTNVWSDPAAARNSTTQLINDLDITLTDPNGTVYRPFVLNAASPANAATTGDDNLNPVEMVVGNAAAGTWQVAVAGTTVPTGPQQYTLITPTDSALNQRPNADAGGPYSGAEGSNIALSASGSSDPDGDPLTYEWDFDGDGFDDGSGVNATFRVGDEGTYTVRVRATDDDNASDVDDGTVNVTNAPPSIQNLASDTPKDEGSTLTISGNVTDPGWLDNLSGTVDWDDGSPPGTLTGTEENNDPDATLDFNPTTHIYGDNGTYDVEVCASDGDGGADCETTTVTINNVNPTLDAGLDQTILEGETTNADSTFTDPGWLDTYSGNVNWGTSYFSDTLATINVAPDNPPNPDSGTAKASQQFGDNGTFTVTTTVTDDDSGAGADSYELTVKNVDPTAVIDTSTGTTTINGNPVFLAHENEPIDFKGNSKDPGSDDLTLTWDWDDGPPSPDESTTYLVNPPFPDPPLAATDWSPSNEPRDQDDEKTHAFADACTYEITFASEDDDDGKANDKANVVIVGNASKDRSLGNWQHQYRRNGKTDYTDDELNCFLEIIDFVSNVFNETRDASTIAKAHDVLWMAQNGGSDDQKFDRSLIAALLNFAQGSTEWTETVKGVTFGDALVLAESVRNDPNRTPAQLHAQRKVMDGYTK